MLTLAGVLLIGYAVVQATLTSTATIPPRLVKQRSVISALWATIFINSGSYIFSTSPLPLPSSQPVFAHHH